MERDNLEDLGVDRSIILEWLLQISVERAWTVLVWMRKKTSSGLM
jgi:hypothetical protein